MFINLTNHPSTKRSEEELDAARQHGEVIDISFPTIELSSYNSENTDRYRQIQNKKSISV